jgi:hypothetical protein
MCCEGVQAVTAFELLMDRILGLIFEFLTMPLQMSLQCNNCLETLFLELP